MRNIVLFVSLVMACGPAFGADKAPTRSTDSTAAKPAPKPAARQESQQEVNPDELDKYVGKRVVVHTKLATTRNGVLLRHSKTEVDLKLDSGAQLSIPVDSIKRITAPIAPPDPLFQTPAQKPGDSSAKKN